MQIYIKLDYFQIKFIMNLSNDMKKAVSIQLQEYLSLQALTNSNSPRIIKTN